MRKWLLILVLLFLPVVGCDKPEEKGTNQPQAKEVDVTKKVKGDKGKAKLAGIDVGNLPAPQK